MILQTKKYQKNAFKIICSELEKNYLTDFIGAINFYGTFTDLHREIVVKVLNNNLKKGFIWV